MKTTEQQTAATGSGSSTPTQPSFDPGVWSLLEAGAWPLLALIALLVLRRHLSDLLDVIVRRIRGGGALKFFNLELGPIRVSAKAPPSSPLITERMDAGGEWEKRREALYKANQFVFIAHRLFPSEIAGQLYDIVIYIIPHEARGATLKGIQRVDYYFGSAWKNRVFSSQDSGNRFAIVVSAYGTGFLCSAQIHFFDKRVVEAWRYIDFEMGPLGDGGVSLDKGASAGANNSSSGAG